MRFLLFSCLSVLVACASAYKELQPVAFDRLCFDKLKPITIDNQLFDAGIDVVGKHISGLLLVKKLDSGETRVVFTNEAGIKFLDFGWSSAEFKVYHIMEQLNKKAIVNLLRRDFELLTGQLYGSSWTAATANNEYFMTSATGDDRIYIVGDQGCTALRRIEIGSTRKRVVSMSYPSADEVLIKHHTFEMEIHLKKIEKQ